MSSTTLESRVWSDDRCFLSWADGAGAYVIAHELKVSSRKVASPDGTAALTSSSSVLCELYYCHMPQQRAEQECTAIPGLDALLPVPVGRLSAAS